MIRPVLAVKEDLQWAVKSVHAAAERVSLE